MNFKPKFEEKDFSFASKFETTINDAKEEQTKTLDVTENGSYNILPDDGKVLSVASVNVNIPTKKEQEKTVEITENGIHTVTPIVGL